MTTTSPFLEKCRGRLWPDADACLFAALFDEAPGARVLVVGCHDEPTANLMQEWGCRVTGVDLREYDAILPPCNYEYVRGDFCDPDVFWERGLKYFGNSSDRMVFYDHGVKYYDAFVAVSTVEHMGFEVYGEGRYHRFYDVIAMRKAWELLGVGGHAYVTVPFGREFREVFPHWRVYDAEAVNERLVQDFRMEAGLYGVSGPCALAGGRAVDVGDPLTEAEALAYSGDPPHVSMAMKLVKVPVNRLAPDGR